MNELNKWFKITMPIPFPMKEVHSYLYNGPKGYVLVDAGVKTPEAKVAFEEGLQLLGINLEDIPHVVITHHHPDHTGLLDYFPESTNVYALERIKPLLLQDPKLLSYSKEIILTYSSRVGVPDEMLPFSLSTLKSIQFGGKRSVTHPLHDGDDLSEILPGYKVLEMPGHASTHIALFHEEESLLMGGDVLLSNVSSNPLIEVPLPHDKEKRKSLIDYENTLIKVYEINPTAILGGHGKTVTNARELVKKRIQKRKERSELIASILRDKNPNNIYEICADVFPKYDNKELFLVLSEVVGHIELLAEEKNELAQHLLDAAFSKR